MNFEQTTRNREMRSLLPKKTNIMALTATANRSTRNIVIKSLEMFKCYTRVKNPNKLNIYFSVQTKPSCVLDVFRLFISDILNSSASPPEKRFCFCRTYDETFHVHETIALHLGEQLFPPSTHADIVKYGYKIRVCEKFDACTSATVKSRIIESFTNPNGAVQMVILAVAFAMGIDVQNIRSVIHWGLRMTLRVTFKKLEEEEEMASLLRQFCTIIKKSVVKSNHMDNKMQSYCLNSDICRRVQLMRQFDEAIL